MPFPNFPTAAKADQRLPKEKILSLPTLKAGDKKMIREQLGFLALRYNLTPGTVNLLPSEAVPGINVFEIHLKDGAKAEKLLTVIDSLFPYHTLFLLREAEQKFSVAIRYKRKNTAGAMKAPDYAPWYMNREVSPAALPLNGPTMEAAYEGFLRFVAGERLRETERTPLGEAIEHSRQLEKIENELLILNKRLYAEKQPFRKQNIFQKIQELKQKLKHLSCARP